MPLAHPVHELTPTRRTTPAALLRVRYVALGLVVLTLYAASLTYLGAASGAVRCSATAPRTAATSTAARGGAEGTVYVPSSLPSPNPPTDGQRRCHEPVPEP